MISRLLLGLGSFSNSMLYTFIFIFFTYQLIEPQLIYTIFSKYATILLYFWKYRNFKSIMKYYETALQMYAFLR